MYWDAASFSYIVVKNEQSNSTTTSEVVDSYSTSNYSYSAPSTTTTSIPSQEVESKPTIETCENENKKVKDNNAAEIAKVCYAI